MYEIDHTHIHMHTLIYTNEKDKQQIIKIWTALFEGNLNQ